MQKELKNDLIRSLVETQTAILEFVSIVDANESGKLHQKQPRFYRQKHSPLLGNSQQQQQQTSIIQQHQTISQINQKYHEQQLNHSATDFQIEREHSIISPKHSVRRELRNSKEPVNFESKNKFQSLYCMDESATEN